MHIAYANIDKERYQKLEQGQNMEVQEDGDHFISSQLGGLASTQMALRAAIELKVFSIIADAGPDAHLSAAEIISKIPTKDPSSAAWTLERVLSVLGANSILSISRKPLGNNGEHGRHEWTYGLTKKSRCLVSSSSAEELANFTTSFILFATEREILESQYMIKDAVLDPGSSPFYKAYGVNFYDYMGEKPRLRQLFDEFMEVSAKLQFEGVFKLYGGFKDLKELMDVGGGIGTTLAKITSTYPHVRGLNFDLPHVIAAAPKLPGVKHVAGDMFKSIPNAETILLKWILHNWDDEHCKKLLRNCWEALPRDGKVIIVEMAISEELENNLEAKDVLMEDFFMMLLMNGGKERTLVEFKDLGKAVGFTKMEIFPIPHWSVHVIEFHK
ncbi:(S)-scoulerine 9-O-methyltransferase-like [Juglans microcarpa x Juglans regia]|uniref:(S)-scoulerine 9-O-methyltransferase-like n=1 Tax=Juglans microcarpa x Juglans regia TaxID=2249226 RepID=UPI001B7E6896|nr:(S)-scoulerine 9-O-methyltransferase-like [Juglans microcarpa x Juglans regia]